MAKVLPLEWQRVYGHPVYYLETFVDPQLFRGTCYRAANWTYLGDTTGRGNHPIDTKDNFEFEREITLSRSNIILDLRRK